MTPSATNRIRVTEYLDVDIDQEKWLCNRCNRELGSACEVEHGDVDKAWARVIRLWGSDSTDVPDYDSYRRADAPVTGAALTRAIVPPSKPVKAAASTREFLLIFIEFSPCVWILT